MSDVPVCKRWRFALEVLAFDLLAATIPRLSRRQVGRLAAALGDWYWRCSARTRHISRANLALAFGDALTSADRDRIGRASCRHFCDTMLSLLWEPATDTVPVADRLEWDAAEWERVQSLRRAGSGLIFVVPHFGDWEALGLLTARLGLTTTVVMDMPANPRLAEQLRRWRSRTGNTVIAQRGAAPKLLRALRRGEAIALLLDLNADPRSGGVWVEFFGKPVYNNAAAAWLALRTGAPLVLATGRRLAPDGKVRATFTPLPVPPRTGDEPADVRALSQMCLRHCEQLIIAAPEFWLWSYKRWKYHPPGATATGFPFYTRPFAGAVAPRGRQSG
jgi:lauroyl/myristoyl acyltransferase